jgi:hypothetical protein
MTRRGILFSVLLLAVGSQPVHLKAQAIITCDTCPVTTVQPTDSKALGPSDASHGCTTQTKHGFPVPDPKCTPGAVNPSVTVDVLKDPKFRTECVRNCSTTESDKNSTYAQYGIPHPANNEGASQVCELDHLISLELGGADTLDNIWPQCGPNQAVLAKRFFKQKDAVENFLAEQVKTGVMDLEKAQTGIATDWTQFLGVAQSFCAKNPKKCKGGN